METNELPKYDSDNPPGPDSGSSRVVRGGSYLVNDLYLRVSIRGSFSPSAANPNLGFRCCRSQ